MRVLICDFDFFSTVGGGQMFYRRIVERNPKMDFFYPSRGRDVWLKAEGQLAPNAHPFIIAATAGMEFQRALDDSVHWVTRSYAALLAEIAAAVQGDAFDVADVPSFLPAAHLVRPVFSCFGVRVDRVALSMLGWNSVSSRASYENLSDIVAVLESEEIDCANAADIRYTISVLEQTLHTRGHQPVQRVDMHDFIEDVPLPEPAPPGSGPPDLWYVGRLDGAKGPDLFIELAARMPRGSYGRCFLAGPDNDWTPDALWSDHVLGLARQRGVDASWLGVLTDAEVRRRAYGGRSVIVVPSRSDSFNYVALEAVLSGCPVLLSVRTGASGFLAAEHPPLAPPVMDPDDLDDAAAKLLRLLNHYPEVACRARREVRSHGLPRPRNGIMAGIYTAPPSRAAESEAWAAKLTALLRSKTPLMSATARAWRHGRKPPTRCPRVSIIITPAERPHFLAPALSSLARQALPDLEVIVVDDGSADPGATRQLVDSYCGFARLKRIGNSGEAGAANRGLEEARGEFMGILSADDMYDPELLALAIGDLERCPDALGIYPDREVMDEAGCPVESQALPDFDRRVMLRAHWCLPGVGSIVRRSAVATIGGWDSSFRSAVNFDFWLRLTAHGPMLHLPRRLAYRRQHRPGQVPPARRREMAKERIRLLDRLFSDPEEAVRSAGDRATAYAAAHLCAAALLGRADEARAFQHLAAAAALDRELCRNLPPNMAKYPSAWPQDYREALSL